MAEQEGERVGVPTAAADHDDLRAAEPEPGRPPTTVPPDQHELVHGWHGRPELGNLPTVTAPAEAAVLALAHEQAWPALGELPGRERLVDAVAMSWFCAAARLPAA